jgi:2-polyprenyl-3-methyl-5-hydroxy-6-metoxy-1,4-benzoquinol methylase
MATTTRNLERAAWANTTAVRCPVCDGSIFDVLLSPGEIEEERRWLAEFYRSRTRDSKDHAEFTQCEATYVVQCRACGTVLRNPRPTEVELARRYRRDRYGIRTLEQLLQSERDFFRGKATAATLPAKARVLEIGSFVGAFLQASKEMGWNAAGVDIGEETREFCLEHGLDVVRDLMEIDGAFDGAFVWNTFDQLADPRQMLRLLRSRLRENGLLVLRIPNGLFEQVALQLRRSRGERVTMAMAYNNFVTFPYLVGYTPDSISRLLDQEGFVVERIAGDTILPLADESTPAWAVREERLFKRAVLRACRLSDRLTCPWIDVHARRTGRRL